GLGRLTAHNYCLRIIPNGGVLLALPALLANGLLHHTRDLYCLPKGFYGIESIFVLLALMALARIKSIEQLRYMAPGEWGNLLGLDRIPEVRTLRQKLEILCQQAGQAVRWNTELAKDWIAGQREATLRHDLVPWLETNAPASAELQQRMQDDPHQHRFTLVFDREGYSPEFFSEMKQRRIAMLSYHKFPGDAWPADEFSDCSVKLAGGGVMTMKLAERGSRLSNGLWVREVRKLSETGRQTSILSTNYRADYTTLAASMFARWSQENFYKYMRQHYNLDRLAEY
ncbi:MAG: putative transposase, partial [Bryobacteraceae bacterium]